MEASGLSLEMVVVAAATGEQIGHDLNVRIASVSEPHWLVSHGKGDFRMTKALHIDLSAVDDRLLDGLDFCRRVYDLFDQIDQQPEGKGRLRLRQSKADKRLVEELLPLACYIQARYQAGRRIKVRWLSGSQPYDAVLWSSGSRVEQGDFPRKLLVEITTSVHPNEYLVRQLLHQQGGSFGVRGIHREKKTGTIISRPYVFNRGENAKDLAEQILARLNAKANKSYPSATLLVLNCIPTCPLLLKDEWEDAITKIENAKPRIPFREVFLLDMLMLHTSTLYGDRQEARPSKKSL